MGMALSLVTQTLNPAEDLTWLGSQDGTQYQRSITLDPTKFTTTSFPGLLVKSGTVLGKITATGLYAPCVSNAVDGSQTAVGFLASTVDLTNHGLVPAGQVTGGALLWRGVVILAKVPQGTAASTGASANGSLDSTAQTTLAGKFRFE